MSIDWEDVLLAYLHDPPDKALCIPGHEGQAMELARLDIRPELECKQLHADTRTCGRALLSAGCLGNRTERGSVVASPTPRGQPARNWTLSIDSVMGEAWWNTRMPCAADQNEVVAGNVVIADREVDAV